MEVFAERKQSRLQPDGIIYCSLLSAYKKGEQREKASEVFAKIKQSGLHPDVITYNALISARAKGNQTEKALEVFVDMKQNGLKPILSHTALSSVLVRMATIQKGPGSPPVMKQWGLQPNVIACSAVVSTCSKGNQT